jgi:glyoxylase-like metal-dependent hydrolase (beta-lactamase superfamily II)
VIRRLSDRILLIEGEKGGRYPHSHSLYLRDGGGILVDCGSDLGEILRLEEEEGLAAILLTHYHEDHFLFLHRFPEVEVWASEGDAPALESLDVLLDRYGVAGTGEEPFFRDLFACKFPFRPRNVARRFADGERIRFGKTEAVMIVAPGHTPGHLCLHFPSEGILFLADYDLSAFGPWYGDKPGGIGEFRRSAAMLAAIGARTNVVSHEAPVHEGSIQAKMEAYLSVIDRREELLRDFLDRPRTREEIVARRIVYGEGRPGPWFDYGEWALLGKHLEGMVTRGEASVEEGRYALR